MLVYPKYETRGDLLDCVGRFTDWYVAGSSTYTPSHASHILTLPRLLEKVIDLEVAAGTPSPTVDPSVRAVLVGHSMGGIVAAETLIRLTSEKPIPPTTLPSQDGAADGEQMGEDAALPPLSTLVFPYVQGILAFDTPFLGISPGVVAHSAEEKYNDASAALGTLGTLFGSKAGATTSRAPAPAPTQDSGWGKWGRMAMYAGAASALAGSAAAAYVHRDNLTQGFSWVSSHLEFVGCLARAEELRRRVAGVVRASDELGLGFANLYTRLGPSAGRKTVGGVVGTVLGRERTFCNLPKGEAGVWREAVNEEAGDETTAHMSEWFRSYPGFRLGS